MHTRRHQYDRRTPEPVIDDGTELELDTPPPSPNTSRSSNYRAYSPSRPAEPLGAPIPRAPRLRHSSPPDLADRTSPVIIVPAAAPDAISILLGKINQLIRSTPRLAASLSPLFPPAPACQLLGRLSSRPIPILRRIHLLASSTAALARSLSRTHRGPIPVGRALIDRISAPNPLIGRPSLPRRSAAPHFRRPTPPRSRLVRSARQLFLASHSISSR